MHDHELERLFDRFRRHGDVPALGAIFDATAPELLHVAMSLVRDPGEADDLLQETFLTAIQRAARYDAERRLVPWLLGILVHHAQERRRVRGRELDPARLAPRTALTPDDEARGRELEAELERALAELGTRERGVLEAYLRHGKGAAEIASELGAAPGAVRMQIHRGLDRLRKALPVGLALGGAASAQGLAAVRSAVLRAGETAVKTLAPGAGSALGAGSAGILMTNKLLVAAVVAALVAGLFLFRSLGSRAPLAAPAEVAQASAPDSMRGSQKSELASASVASEPASSVESVPSARVATAPAVDPDRAGLRGRVVESDGTPVAGLEIGLLQVDEERLFPAQLAALDVMRGPELVTATTRTGADGRFLLPGASTRAVSALGLDLGGERASLRVLDAELVPGETSDLGDVVLSATGAVAGRVVDEQGHGVAGARVRIGPVPGILAEYGIVHLAAGSAVAELGEDSVRSVFELPPWISALEARLPFATTTTGLDGRFVLARVASGTQTAVVDAPGFARLVSEPFVLDAGERAEPELALTRGASVHGRVLDSAGRAVAGAEVRAGISSRDDEATILGPIARCDAEGRFTVEHLPAGWKQLALARRDVHGCWVLARAVGDGFVAELPEERELVLEVVDHAGTPVPRPEFFLRALGDSREEALLVTPPLLPCAAHVLDDGRWSLGPIGAGRYRVLARASGLAPSSSLIEVGPSLPPVTRLLLDSVRSVTVHVFDAATRSPLAGARVLAEEARARTGALASARTDADGRAVLALPSSPEQPLWLRVEHPRFAPIGRALDAASEIEVTLGAGARLVARLADPVLARKRCMLNLQYNGVKGHFDMSLPRLVAMPGEGALELENLPAGEWSYGLYPSLFQGEALTFLDPDRAPRPYFEGEFTLAEGETHELVLVDESVPVEAPAEGVEVSGVVRVGGAIRDVQVTLFPMGPGSGEQKYVDARGGRFLFEGVQPGRYGLVAYGGGAFGGRSAESAEGEEEQGEAGITSLVSEEIEVEGEDLALEYDVALHAATVVTLDADGLPRPGTQVTASPIDPDRISTSSSAVSGADGRARLQLSRTGRYRLVACHAEQGFGRGEVEVGSSDSPEATVRLARGVECSGRIRIDPALAASRENAWMSVRAKDDLAYEVGTAVEFSEASGAFHLVGLEPGTYLVSLWGEQPLYGTFDLPEGGSSTLELALSTRPTSR